MVSGTVGLWCCWSLVLLVSGDFGLSFGLWLFWGWHKINTGDAAPVAGVVEGRCEGRGRKEVAFEGENVMLQVWDELVFW